eukprot:1331640-Pleurochrysis_carterae.AAC.1
MQEWHPEGRGRGGERGAAYEVPHVRPHVRAEVRPRGGVQLERRGAHVGRVLPRHGRPRFAAVLESGCQACAA